MTAGKPKNDGTNRTSRQPMTRMRILVIAVVVVIALFGAGVLVGRGLAGLARSNEAASQAVSEGIALTATQIIADATATAQAGGGAPAEMLEPLMMTATAIIATATAQASP